MHKALIKISLITILALASLPTYAQPEIGDNELIISAGILSGTEMIGMKKAHGIYDEAGYNQISHSPNLFFTWRHFIRYKLAIGITAGTQQMSYQYINSGTAHDYQNYTTDARVSTLAIEIKKVYTANVELKNLEFYLFAGLGARYFQETQTPTQPNPTLPLINFNSQWSPICIKYGNKINAFVEFGFGYKGLINTGLSFKFNREKTIVIDL